MLLDMEGTSFMFKEEKCSLMITILLFFSVVAGESFDCI
jgi:hypothetical protein